MPRDDDSAKTNRVAVAGSGQGLDWANWSAVVDNGVDLSLDGFEQRRRAGQRLDDRGFKSVNRAAGFPGLDFLASAVRVVAHPLGVRSRAVGTTFEKRGTVAGAGSLDRMGGGFENGEYVIAVDIDSGHSVTGSPAGHAGVGGRVGKGDFGRELVVLAHEQNRQFPDAGHVEPFMEGAVVDGPIAEESDGHLIGLEQLETISGPGGLKDAWTDDPARTHHPRLGSKQVHAAAASLGATGRAAKSSATN